MTQRDLYVTMQEYELCLTQLMAFKLVSYVVGHITACGTFKSFTPKLSIRNVCAVRKSQMFASSLVINT